MTTSNKTVKTFDVYGNLLTSAVYGFGASTPSFTTTNTYSGCGAGATIVDKVCDSKVSDGANTVSESKYTYSSGGNPLTSSVWTGTKWLTTTKTFNTNGTTLTELLPDGQSYTYGYGSASCGNAFATSATIGTVTTYSAWNCDGGVQTSATDGNGAVTGFGYTNAAGTADPFWRKSSTTDPLLNTAYTIYGANSTEYKFSFGSSVEDSIVTVDGYGRQKRKQTAQNGAYATLSTSYGFNAIGATVTTSVACSKPLGADCTTGLTTVVHDAIGRLFSSSDGGGGTVNKTYTKQDVLTVVGPHPTGEVLKQFQKEYDGLGRLTFTCGILGSGGSTCGQATGSSGGVSTSYIYTTGAGTATTTSVRGVQTRITVKDGLGRVTSRTDPEKTAATKSYYDAVAACPGSVDSHLSETVNAAGVVICYYYDGFGRLRKTISNGFPQECNYFYYDNSAGYSGTIPTGITPTYPVGRMVEAANDGCSGSLVMDEWFGYSKRGELTDVWEKTPHSGGYYHTTATYFANGKINTLSGIPGYPAYTYSVNADGQSSQASAGGVLLASGVTYGPTGVTNVDIGAGTDGDTYTYDPLTGRMTQYQFFVGSGSSKGVLGWNPDGQLGSLLISA